MSRPPRKAITERLIAAMKRWLPDEPAEIDFSRITPSLSAGDVAALQRLGSNRRASK